MGNILVSLIAKANEERKLPGNCEIKTGHPQTQESHKTKLRLIFAIIRKFTFRFWKPGTPAISFPIDEIIERKQ